MKKRIVSCLLVACLLSSVFFGTTVMAAELKSFSDVSNSEWYAPYVYALYQKDIVSGMTDTSFGPGQKLTRAQLVTMLANRESKETLETYRNKNTFPDVPGNQWYAPYVNWAAERGFVSGYTDGKFGPNRSVTRAEAATMVVQFVKMTDDMELKKVKEAENFSDDSKIPNWARDYISQSQQAGLFSGYKDGSFKPDNQMTRAEASVVLCRLFDVEPLSKDQLPKTTASAITNIQKTAGGVYVNGVEFRGYKASVVLANNKFYSTESASSMFQRSGGAVVCNGAFFNNQGDLTTYSAFVRDGKALRIDNANYPYKCYFVVDKSNNASMQFMKICQTATLIRDGAPVDGATLEEVSTNYSFAQDDGSRVIFTKEFGKSTVPGTVKVAVYCDENGKVTKVIDSATPQTVSIPDKGYVICERKRRDEGSEYPWEFFFEKIHVGDTVDLSLKYEGSKVQDIQMAFCCGPTVVKNGKAYGNTTTYAQEGYTEGKIISGSGQRTCIGVKADGTVVIIVANTSMSGLSNAMVALGCQTAMNLDGGASSALYVNGSARVAAGRQLTHMIVFSK